MLKFYHRGRIRANRNMNKNDPVPPPVDTLSAALSRRPTRLFNGSRDVSRDSNSSYIAQTRQERGGPKLPLCTGGRPWENRYGGGSE